MSLENLTFLTPEEKKIVKILFNSKASLSIKQIMKKYLKEVISENKERLKDIGLENHEHIEVLKDKEIQNLISKVNKYLPEKIPSYYTIKAILEYLEAQKIVKRRELAKGRAKTVWYFSFSNGDEKCQA